MKVYMIKLHNMPTLFETLMPLQYSHCLCLLVGLIEDIGVLNMGK